MKPAATATTVRSTAATTATTLGECGDRSASKQNGNG